ncbi:MAG: TnpV protein [Oscillospiraceae bacterium]|nr:TnpV protein [Oscillospiraceae bacterium]MBR6953490.1 TnpV protein [Clostridia bacterium]
MHKAYLEEVHPDLYRQLLQDGILDRYLAEVNARAVSVLEQLTVQMAR